MASDPQNARALSAEKQVSAEPQLPEQNLATLNRGEAQSQGGFLDAQNLHPGWRLLIYLVCVFLAVYLLMWFGTSFFSEPVRGAAVLWQEMYAQAAMLLGALLPAVMMARVEGRNLDVYGLPRSEAFGKMFWIGAVWGLISLSVLLVSLRGMHAFYFGHLALHGTRILKFAVFWGIYFVLVGLFEEFLMRGYTLFTLTQAIGFWPSAVVLSTAFGAIHFRNPGETWAGLAAAAAIGIFFCFTLYRTGSLWFAVGFHASWDWGQTYLFSVPDSGTMEPGHLMQPSIHGPEWLSGGSVGPEGSMVCFVVIAGLCVAFSQRYKRTKWQPSLLTRTAGSPPTQSP
jgi:uncharacterized protein